MATWKFVTRKKSGTCPIILRYVHNSKPIDIPIKHKIHADFWDNSEGKLARNCPSAQRQELTEEMNKWAANITAIISTRKKNYFSLKPADVKQELLDLMNRPEQSSSLTPSVNDTYTTYISKRKGTVKPNTIQIYEHTKFLLEEYCKKKKVRLDWSLFDSDFENEWRDYLFDEEEMQNVTVGKYFKTLKTFLRWCYEEKRYLTNDAYRKYKVEQSNQQIIPCNAHDLSLLKQYAATEKSEDNLLVVRAFLFLCYTGLRISDFEKLTLKNLLHEFDAHNEPTFALNINSQKTQQWIHIPLTQTALDQIKFYNPDLFQPIYYGMKPNPNNPDADMDYLGDYDFEPIIEKFPNRPLFPKIYSQDLNVKIKLIGEACGINTTVIKNTKYRTEVNEVSFKKFEILTCHTGRRTFITLALKAGIPIPVIMKMTGHTSYKTILRYINIDKEFVFVEMEKFDKRPIIEETVKTVEEEFKHLSTEIRTKEI